MKRFISKFNSLPLIVKGLILLTSIILIGSLGAFAYNHIQFTNAQLSLINAPVQVPISYVTSIKVASYPQSYPVVVAKPISKPQPAAAPKKVTAPTLPPAPKYNYFKSIHFNLSFTYDTSLGTAYSGQYVPVQPNAIETIYFKNGEVDINPMGTGSGGSYVSVSSYTLRASSGQTFNIVVSKSGSTYYYRASWLDHSTGKGVIVNYRNTNLSTLKVIADHIVTSMKFSL